MEYVHWLAEVNSILGRLTNQVLSAEDFDYPWIEVWMKGKEPEQAATEALEGDGFVVEKLPAPAMLIKESTPRVSEAALAYFERPSARIERSPLVELRDSDLLALLIGGPYASSDAEQLLQAIGGNLNRLYNASLTELARNYRGVGLVTAKRLQAALELGRRLAFPESRLQITCPRDAAEYLCKFGLDQCEQEELWALSLDTKNRILHLAKVYRGNVNSSIIREAEIIRDAVRIQASSMIVAHNHPSGDPTPSPEDVHVTRKIKAACDMLSIELMDHLVLGNGLRFVSLKERGLGFE